MRFEAVLFDCDGVLVDSEPLTNGVLRSMLAELGWQLTPQECMQIFVGKAVKDESEQIFQNTGFRVTEDWLAGFRDRRNVVLERELQPIDGIHEAVQALHAQFGGRLACASGADRFKVELQLRKVGLHTYFDGQIYSGHEMPRTKPAPDVYLAAAAGLAADPANCIVVEDTVTGATAGAAAGALVLGYAPTGDESALRQAGASHCFTHMSDLPKLVTTLLSS
jgi:HAD superfamily hydrolase (TIGR01509 family)